MSELQRIESWRDLDDLPVGSVVLHTPCADDSTGAVCVWTSPNSPTWWASPGDCSEYDSHDVISHMDEGDSLLVLWTPPTEAQP